MMVTDMVVSGFVEPSRARSRARRPARPSLPRAALMLLPLLAACSPGAAEGASSSAPSASTGPGAAGAAHPISGLEVIPLTVDTGAQRHDFRVEVARTGEEQAQGLMFRTEMGPDEGMLFPFDPPRMTSFWMKNTVLSLDLIFIDGEGRVINVAAHAVPYSEAPIRSEAPAAAVLELNAGRAAELGIAPGATISW